MFICSLYIVLTSTTCTTRDSRLKRKQLLTSEDAEGKHTSNNKSKSLVWWINWHLGYNDFQSGSKLPTTWRSITASILHPKSWRLGCTKNMHSCLFGLFVYPEAGCSIFFWIISNLLPNYTISHCRRQQSTYIYLIQARVFVPPMFIAQEPQMPSRQERRNVSVGSTSFFILISASKTMGPHL